MACFTCTLGPLVLFDEVQKSWALIALLTIYSYGARWFIKPPRAWVQLQRFQQHAWILGSFLLSRELTTIWSKADQLIRERAQAFHTTGLKVSAARELQLTHEYTPQNREETCQNIVLLHQQLLSKELLKQQLHYWTALTSGFKWLKAKCSWINLQHSNMLRVEQSLAHWDLDKWY